MCENDGKNGKVKKLKSWKSTSFFEIEDNYDLYKNIFCF